MGNSTGMILPKPVPRELGVESGTMMDVVVENGRVVATPVRRDVHAGWAEAADWLGFANEDDDTLAW